jgi:hypothetical protein
MVQGGRMFRQQQTDQPDDGRDNLFAPMDGPGRVTGDFGQGAFSVSPYTRFLELHPNRKRALLATALAGLAAFTFRSRRE